MYIHYTGVVNVTPELGQILSGQAESLTTPYGDSCKLLASCLFFRLDFADCSDVVIHMTFEVRLPASELI